jgi:hypothetical protein
MFRIRSKDGAAIWLSVVTAVSFVGGEMGGTWAEAYLLLNCCGYGPREVDNTVVTSEPIRFMIDKAQG